MRPDTIGRILRDDCSEYLDGARWLPYGLPGTVSDTTGAGGRMHMSRSAHRCRRGVQRRSSERSHHQAIEGASGGGPDGRRGAVSVTDTPQVAVGSGYEWWFRGLA
ncbi:hypothetical protein DFR68_105289 [Nocardia mexicana]|uniref:Uncharacterized protein n=1 Tax=Nocardia mexicana TaxID=279262 RepID=A0A370H5P8_9NOCA|nr:hypothetical protein DFR68_105289 [Nocardia mexicana]